MVKQRAKKTKEKLLMRIVKGGFEPLDDYTTDRLKAKGFHVGDVVSITASKPRNVKFHRLAHALGRLVIDNIDSFDDLTAHEALKRLQLEANAECDEIFIKLPQFGVVPYRMPRSMAFTEMEQGEFEEFYSKICRHLAENYWTDLTPNQVEAMAETMPD